MSKGVVVVEAPQRSGALITADFALEQNREVFAMPGNINSAKSSGTNRLIKEGAKLVEGLEDILEELESVMDIKELTLKNPRPDTRNPNLSSISPEEKAIFSILDNSPKSLDEISEITDFPIRRISEVLLKLELKKLIKMLPGENFIKV